MLINTNEVCIGIIIQLVAYEGHNTAGMHDSVIERGQLLAVRQCRGWIDRDG